MTFSVVNGNGFLGVGENGALAMSVRVRANVSGNAQAWVCLAGDVSGPVTIQATVPGSAPVFFVAHPLAAPHNLTARALSPFSIDLAWQAGSGAPAGSGFIIERREALAATGPFTPWHELTRYFGTATTFQDQRLAAGQVAMYRVQAFVGSGSAERHSAPSNLAMQAMWQDPNTPSADPGGGEDGDGDGALGDPTGGEGGDNNYWIAGDGDGDGDPDNDKDGIVDTGDRYPEDPRRSEDIPVKFYGVIDLSAALAESFTVTNAITATGGKALISIDDTNRVGFAGIEQLPNGQSIIRSATWFNGVATQSSRLLYDQSGNDWKQYLPEPYGVTPEGLVIGNFIGTYGQVDQNVSPLSWPGYFTFQNGLLSLHASTPPTGPRTYTSVLLMSPSGVGMFRDIVPNAVGTASHVSVTFANTPLAYDYDPSIGNVTYTHAGHAASAPSEAGETLLWSATNNQTGTRYLTITTVGSSGPTHEPISLGGQSIAPNPPPENCKAINAQKQIVGSLRYYPPSPQIPISNTAWTRNVENSASSGKMGKQESSTTSCQRSSGSSSGQPFLI